jgi:carboxylesterase
MVGTTDRDWYEDAENALLDLLQDAKKVIVVGLSMGGLLALELAARYREEVAGVVAVAAALKFKDPLAVLTPVLSKVVKFWNSPNAFNDLELKKKENRNYPKFATDAFASLYRYASQVHNLLSFVKADILILHSKKDQIIAPKSAQIIYEKVSSKNKEIKWFEKSGHEMLLDLERDDVIKAVVDFISAHIS